MLDKLKTDFDAILELVRKAPQPLQDTALKTILENWFKGNTVATTAPAAPAAAPPTPAAPAGAPALPSQVIAFMTANAITGDLMAKAFQPLGPGAQLLATEIDGTGKAGKTASLAALLSVKNALETGVFSVTLASVREMCTHYDCYDATNFSKTFKQYKSLFKPRAKGADLELSGPGQKKAAELIKGLQATS